jgi:YD repeat-containing protein
LLSTTNPENGTVTYTYNSDKTLATKTDAKGQQILYSYDSLKRITQVRRYLPSGGQLVEDTCQQENYGYDFGSYGLGRLVEIQYKGGYTPGANPTCTTTFDELYTYNAAGSILTAVRYITALSVEKLLPPLHVTGTRDSPQ